MPLYKKHPLSYYAKKKKKVPPMKKKAYRRLGRMNPIKSSIPEHLQTALIYNTGQIGSTTTTTPGGFVIYVNNLYDLFNNSAYTQPRMFDQLAALYQKYRVNAVKVEIMCSELTGSGYFAHGFFQHDYTASNNNLKSMAEDCRYRIVTTSSNKGPMNLRAYRKLHSVEDITPRQYREDDNYQAAVNASTTFKPQFRLYFQALDETTSHGFWVQCRFVFYTTFFQLKQPSAS